MEGVGGTFDFCKNFTIFEAIDKGGFWKFKTKKGAQKIIIWLLCGVYTQPQIYMCRMGPIQAQEPLFIKKYVIKYLYYLYVIIPWVFHIIQSHFTLQFANHVSLFQQRRDT